MDCGGKGQGSGMVSFYNGCGKRTALDGSSFVSEERPTQWTFAVADLVRSCGRWHCFEEGTFPVPVFVETDEDGSRLLNWREEYYKYATPRFVDSDWPVLCGGPLINAGNDVPRDIVRKSTVPPRMGADVAPSNHSYSQSVDAGLQSFRLPSLSDCVARVGLTKRDISATPVLLRCPSTLCWKKGEEILNNTPQLGNASDFEVALQTLGLQTTYLPSGKRENAKAIMSLQASMLNLALEQAEEIVEFVTRMSNAGHNLRHDQEQKKVAVHLQHTPSKRSKPSQAELAS
jgi:hypothetical protein